MFAIKKQGNIKARNKSLQKLIVDEVNADKLTKNIIEL